MTLSTSDFTPVADELIQEFKQHLTGTSGLIAAYLYGVMWRLCGETVFNGSKADISRLSTLDPKTINKYLNWLIENEYIEEIYPNSETVKPSYKISKSDTFRFTIHLSTTPNEKYGIFPKSKMRSMSAKVRSMSAKNAEHVRKNAPIMIHDDNIHGIKDKWIQLGLDTPALKAMLKFQSESQLETLLDDWLDWLDYATEAERNRYGPGLIFNSLKDGLFAPAGEQTSFVDEVGEMMRIQQEQGMGVYANGH